jgi:hypothetical protein
MRSGGGPGSGGGGTVRTRVPDLDADRLVAGRVDAGALLRAALDAAGLRAVLRVAGLRAAFLGAGSAVAPEAAARATCCTCLLIASRRFRTLSISAWRAVRSSWLCTRAIAAWTVFCPSSTLFSICLRRSGGTRLSALRKADRPAFTARFKSCSRVEARFFVATCQPPLNTVFVRHNAAR